MLRRNPVQALNPEPPPLPLLPPPAVLMPHSLMLDRAADGADMGGRCSCRLRRRVLGVQPSPLPPPPPAKGLAPLASVAERGVVGVPAALSAPAANRPALMRR